MADGLPRAVLRRPPVSWITLGEPIWWSRTSPSSGSASKSDTTRIDTDERALLVLLPSCNRSRTPKPASPPGVADRHDLGVARHRGGHAAAVSILRVTGRHRRRTDGLTLDEPGRGKASGCAASNGVSSTATVHLGSHESPWAETREPVADGAGFGLIRAPRLSRRRTEP
jgi:hypothetical protein